jgi:hypothetical protein
MCLGIEHNLVEGQDVIGPEEEVKVLESFSLRGNVSISDH